jgi:hypothetical protein
MKRAAIIFLVLIVILIAMRFIRTKKAGSVDKSDGHIISETESENSNLLFLALNRVGIH